MHIDSSYNKKIITTEIELGYFPFNTIFHSLLSKVNSFAPRSATSSFFNRLQINLNLVT